MFYFDPIYLLFITPGLLIGLIATILLRLWGNEYKSTQNINHISGSELASAISQNMGLKLQLRVTPDEYNDSFDPRDRTLTLSNETAYGTTITSVAITAHELGHALQHKQKSALMSLRNILVPIVNIGTNLGYFLIVFGFVINALRLSEIGIIFFSLSTVFTLLTLPIEIDASNRALHILKTQNILYPDEISGARKVLTAAALTYVAALFESIGQILYFLFRIKRRE